MKSLFPYILVFCFIFALSDPADGDDIVEALRYETDINDLYNRINRMEWTSDNLRTVYHLWNREFDRFPGIPDELLENDILRLAFANVLLQAQRHCRIYYVDVGELREYLLSKSKSKDLGVRGRAIYLLGLARVYC